MQFLRKLNSDSKAIIQDLRDLNDSLINAVGEYQLIIFELKETIENQKEEIEKLQETILKGDFTSYVAEKAKDEWRRGNIEHINRLKAEIERLQKNEQIATEVIEESSAEVERLKEGIKFERERVDNIPNLLLQAKSEAIREFAERLIDITVGNWEYRVDIATIDNLVKEMVGDE